MMRHILLFASTLILGACASEPTDALPEGITACPDERPQVCTMIYAPVCALTEEGERKTFASDCVACGDEAVIGFETGGPCPE
ncbi:MAG: hypothetical protein JJ921_12845 [Pseudomonadales bacterium]|nr:hypothetical protein [Pseudomonadales bacterium]